MKNEYSNFMDSLAAGEQKQQQSHPLHANSSLYYQINSGHQSPVSPGTSEFCTIRRIPRKPKSAAMAIGDLHLSEKCDLIPGNGIHLQDSGGSLNSISNRRSAFVPNTYSPPPPPPYPRVNPSMLTSSNEIIDDSKREFFEGDGASCNEEAKYIFSSEAMLKPGTLV